MQVRSAVAVRSALQPIGLFHAFEAGTVFFLLLAYIWYFQARFHAGWMVILGIVIVSHIVRGERPSMLGFRGAGFRDCARRFALPVLIVAAIGTAAGFAMDTVRDVKPISVAGVLIGYCAWALFQQYVLNGYFVTRIAASVDERRQFIVAPMAGMIFAAAHAPNMLLMGVTLVGGTIAAAAFLKHRNLLFLALAHALIGTMIWLVIPDSVSHHLRVGPGMLRAHAHHQHAPVVATK